MEELEIPIRQHIGPGYWNEETWEYIPGTTQDEIQMYVEFYQPKSILLTIGACYGGSCFHAYDIYNYLKALKIPIRAHVRAVCASSGTIVALAAKEVSADEASLWLAHNPHFPDGTPSGTPAQLRADAEMLEKNIDLFARIYSERTGKTIEEIKVLMDQDKYITADEAATWGFITKVIPVGAGVQVAPVEARAQRVRQLVAQVNSNPAIHTKTDNMKDNTPSAQDKSFWEGIKKDIEGLKALVTGTKGPKAEGEEIKTEDDKAEAVSDKLADGRAIEYEALEVGKLVEVVAEDGTKTPLEEGTHALESGAELTVDSAGVITEVKDANAVALAAKDARIAELEAEVKGNKEAMAKVQDIEAKLEQLGKTILKAQANSAGAPVPQVTPKATTATGSHPMDQKKK